MQHARGWFVKPYHAYLLFVSVVCLQSMTLLPVHLDIEAAAALHGKKVP